MNISRNVLLAALVTLGLPVFAAEAPKTEAAAEAPKTEQVATPAVVEAPRAEATEAKGFFAKAGALIASPFVFTANGTVSVVDWVAANGGSERLATWLGSKVAFFGDHSDAVKRTFALAEVAIVAAAVKAAYDAFVAEEDNNEDEYDFADVEFADNE